MANVTITREEAEDDLLPNVCPITGEECVHRMRRTFGWSPGWVWVLVFCMPLVGLILWACLRQQMILQVSVVARQRLHWAWRTALAVPCGVVGWFFAVTGIRSLLLIGLMEAESALIVYGIILVGVLLCVAGLIPWFRSVRATAITRKQITLTNVHKAFTAAVREGRERRARDEADREERREQRRRPRTAYPVGTPPEQRQEPPPPPPKDDQAPWW